MVGGLNNNIYTDPAEHYDHQHVHWSKLILFFITMTVVFGKVRVNILPSEHEKWRTRVELSWQGESDKVIRS